MKESYDSVPHEEGDDDEKFDDQGVNVENNVEEDDMEPGVAAADDAARKREYQKYKTQSSTYNDSQ